MEKVWLKHYEESVSPTITYPEITLYEYLVQAAKEYPDNPAFSFFGNTLSYQKTLQYVDQFAEALYDLGVRKGTRVAIMLPNLPQYPITHYAIMKLGGIIVPTNPLYVEREIQQQMNNSGAEYIIVLNLLFKRIKNVWKETPLKKIIVTGVKEYLPGIFKLLYPIKEKKEGTYTKVEPEKGVVFFQELMKKKFSPIPQVKVNIDETAMFLYTGGTTGISKGAVLTHRNLTANSFQTKAWLTSIRDGKDVILSALPYFHSYGMTTCMHLSLVSKAKAVLIPRFDTKMVLEAIQKHQVSVFPGVPTMYIAINHYPNVQKYKLNSVKACISGGAALPGEVQKEFERLTGGKLVEGYGLSEASPVTHANVVYGLRKEGSIGIPFPSTEAKVVDSQTLTELPIGEIGELAIKGPQIMKEYWQRSDETSQALHEGWLLTGDMAKVDEDGYFYIVDRKKDMIIASGFNIYPREVEEVLFLNPKIAEAAVVGIPDEYRGETVKAFVVLKEGQTTTDEEIKEFCQGKLAKFKVPKQVEFRKELPKSLIGKVLRRKLVEEEKLRIGETKK